MATKAITIQMSNQLWNVCEICFCSFFRAIFSLPITDTTNTAIPTASPLPIAIGSVHIFTNSKAFTASSILVKNIISIWRTSVTIPIPIPYSQVGFLSSNIYFLSIAAINPARMVDTEQAI